jgi:hypothetical protein
MKKATTIAGLIALSMIAIMTISTATAFTEAYILISGPGSIWQFAPSANVDGKNIVTVTAEIHTEGGWVTIPADNLISANGNKKVVTLVFDSTYTSQFGGTVDKSRVTIVDKDGNSQFVADGAGFAWGRLRS